MPAIDKTRLKPYLEDKLGGEDLAITSVWKNLEGWSMETYSLGLSYTKDDKRIEQDIIIRKEPEGGVHGTEYDCSIEYKILIALKKIDIAVPETYWIESDPDVMGRPFYVMEKVEGQIPLPPAISFDPNERVFESDEQRLSLADDFVKNLVKIHTADWKKIGIDFLPDPGRGTGSALAQIEFWEDQIQEVGFGHKPALTYAKCWLKDNLVENDTPAIIHSDYRTGNYIVRDNQIVAVLDWELVHLGDPHEDLAYILSAWRGAPPEKRLSHLIPEEEFFQRYQEAGGIKIDKVKLDFYIFFHHYKSIGMMSRGAQAFKKHNVDLKVGVFGMGQYLNYYMIINEFKKHNKIVTGA